MNTNEIIIVDIFKSEIIKKFKEENYFFSNIPYNMIAAEGKFSENGDYFVISTYLGSISVYSMYSRNSYSTTYMNQFFDDEFRARKDELNEIFPEYVNMYNLPYITQQPYSYFKLQTIKENKRLTSNYSMSIKEINRKIFNNINYSEKAFEERQEDCEKEEKAYILAAKDNITYMINDQDPSGADSLDESDVSSEPYIRNRNTTGANTNNRENNTNQQIENNRIGAEINDYEFSSSYEEDMEDLEDEEVISLDSDDIKISKNFKSNKYLGEKSRTRRNGNTANNTIQSNNNNISERAKRWNLRSKDAKIKKMDGFINDESESQEIENYSEGKGAENRYSKSLRTRSSQPIYNDNFFLNQNQKQNPTNSRIRKRLRKLKGNKLGLKEKDNLPKVRTRLGRRSRESNLNAKNGKKSNIIEDEEEEMELDDELYSDKNTRFKLTGNDNSYEIRNKSSANNILDNAVNSNYRTRRSNKNIYNNINIDEIDTRNMKNGYKNLLDNEENEFVDRINYKTKNKKRNIDDFDSNSTVLPNGASSTKNLNLGLFSLSNYEKKKQLSSENYISSFKDINYNPIEYLNNLPNGEFSDFAKQLIKNCENKIELCHFCGNKTKNIVGPFYKNYIASTNSYFYSLNKKPSNDDNEKSNHQKNWSNKMFSDEDFIFREVEGVIYFHIDCLLLFNQNIDLNTKNVTLEPEEKEYILPENLSSLINAKIISKAINQTESLNKPCFRCGSGNATYKCAEEECDKYFHGNVCLAKYCLVFNKYIACFECVRKKFSYEERQKEKFANAINKNPLDYLNFYSDIPRDFFLRNTFSFYNYYPQKGEKVYFVLQAYEDFVKRYYQYIIFELDVENIFFWKRFENNNISSNKKFNPYYPFLCEVKNIEYMFNNAQTINYLKKIHRGSYREKINIVIKLTLQIFEINKTFDIIFMENSEPDFLINYNNYKVNLDYYETLQKNFLTGNIQNSFLETVIAEINYKGRVFEVMTSIFNFI